MGWSTPMALYTPPPPRICVYKMQPIGCSVANPLLHWMGASEGKGASRVISILGGQKGANQNELPLCIPELIRLPFPW